MVKGTSRRVVVVDSPDKKLFEQAIFIVRSDAMTKEGVTPQDILGEACRIAGGCSGEEKREIPFWQKIPRWAWYLMAAAAGGAVWLILWLTHVI